MTQKSLLVSQCNVFYNYTLGLDITSVDLVKTAVKALKKGISPCAFFSDSKLLYLDSDGNIQFEWIELEGRRWDARYSFDLPNELPSRVRDNLLLNLEAYFHERLIMVEETSSRPYLRLSLPPIVLGKDEYVLPLHVSCKIFSDGIAILSFQLDTTWNNISEDFFVSEVVNLSKQYFENVWVNSTIQRLDSEVVIPYAFTDELTFAGNPLKGYRIHRLVRKMRKQSLGVVEEALARKGRVFNIDGEPLTLHEISGSDNGKAWESNLDLCRSMNTHALTKIIVPKDGQRRGSTTVVRWEGRPAITLMRFHDQPEDKMKLLTEFGYSLSRVLSRSVATGDSLPLPEDLRPMNDYAFHGNRSILLWTWTKSADSASDAWKEPETTSLIMGHQVVAEHIEYSNMKLARACALAQSPPSDGHLVEAYRILSMAEMDLHDATNAGEVTNAIKILVKKFGTYDLLSPAKEAARWYLDEMRYESEKRRSLVDRWLTLAFGLFGTTNVADFLVNPYVEKMLGEDSVLNPIVSFIIASAIVVVVIFLFFAVISIAQRG